MDANNLPIDQTESTCIRKRRRADNVENDPKQYSREKSPEKKKFKIDGNVSAATQVACNEQLMEHIIREISSAKDINNCMLVCKNFYSICCRKSYTPLLSIKGEELSNDEMINNSRCLAKISNHNYNFKVIIKDLYLREKVKKSLVNVLLRNRKVMDKLFIQHISSGDTSFYININCFENIKTFETSYFALRNDCLKILNRCTTLKPYTLVLKKLRDDDIDPLSSRDDGEHFPRYIRNIKLNYPFDHIKWLLEKFEDFDNNYFDLLDISNFDLSTFLSNNGFPKIWNFFKYFKNFKITVSNECTTDILKTLIFCPDISIPKMVDLTVQYNSSYSDFTSSYLMYYENLGRPTPSKKERSPRILCEKFDKSKINSFKFEFSKYSQKAYSMLPSVNTICEDLFGMTKLKTIEIDMKFFHRLEFIYKVVPNINRYLRNIKLNNVDCFDISDLEKMSNRFYKLENLVLCGVTKSDIELEKIVPLFKKLTGFSIQYKPHGTVCKLISCLRNSSGGLNWPKIPFVQICFLMTNGVRKMLYKIDKNTPRRPGKFIIDECSGLIGRKSKGENMCTVIIQDLTQRYDEFIKVF
uniref:F-box domain-containing protein n=1 Tax=Parastrongyloides trichosuri TaxID=131310 RepID=A0A0N4Z5K0_PARTI